MKTTHHDELDEPAPDSGTERTRGRAERDANEDFESEHERRFFSEHPAFREEHTLPSLEPVVAESEPGTPGDDETRVTSAEEQAWLERARTRRAALQRWVALAISTGAVALLIAGADHYVSAHHFPAAAPVAPTRPVKASQPAEPVEAATAKPPPTATTPPTVIVSAPPAPAPSADVESSVPAAAAATGVLPSDDTSTLLAKARALLAAGHTRAGVAVARTAVGRDPLDARSYVLLGAGLQDLGDWAAARGVFQDCVRQATRGPNAACRYFARR